MQGRACVSPTETMIEPRGTDDRYRCAEDLRKGLHAVLLCLWSQCHVGLRTLEPQHEEMSPGPYM